MSDDADLANDHAQFAEHLALQHFKAGQVLEPQRVVDGEVLCSDCGNDIPAARLAALLHCVRCIGCQMAYEKEMKQCQ